MGLFDFLKKKKTDPVKKEIIEQPKQDNSITTQGQISQEKPLLPYSDYTIFYENGHVVKIIPPPPNGYYVDRDIIYSGTNIVSDGVKYDLTDIKSILSLPIPNYDSYKPNCVSDELGVTGTLDYTLRMRSARYWNEHNFNLSLCCQEKATLLMRYSSVGWERKDFYRIVNEMRSLGYLKKANEWKTWIDSNIPDHAGVAQNAFKERLVSAKELGTNLVEVGDIGACCEKCAKYRKRIYCVDGRDKRFPKFPKDFHLDCGLSIWPYIYGVYEPSFHCTDIIAYSNRPYIDDRTQDEKEAYEKRLQIMQHQEMYEYPPDLNCIIYYRLCILLPEDAPKTLSGFSRMKNANSKHYQELIKKAESAGFVFPKSIDDVWNWPINK